MVRPCFVLVLAVLVSGCSSETDGAGGTYACRYNESSSFICTGFSDYSDDEHCVEVSSPERCDEITESYNDCTGDCCSDTSYYDVSVTAGSCDDSLTSSGGTSSAGSGGTSGLQGTGGSGETSGSGGSGGNDVCAIDAADSDCGACLKMWCCTEFETCAATTCVDLTACIADCSADSCFSTCETLYPDGITPLNDLFDCSTTWCSVE